MKRGATALLGAALAAASCQRVAPIEPRDLALRIRVDPGEIELGRAFALTVVRTWRRDFTPQPWSDASLAPLVLRRVATDRREEADRIEETSRCEAWAFARGELVVPAPTLTATGPDGRERMATTEALRLSARPSLDPTDPGAPELPEELQPAGGARASRAHVAAGLAAIALAAAWIARRRQRARALPAAAAPAGGPDPAAQRALARLKALRERPPRARHEEEAWHAEAAALLRDFLAERFELPAPRRTTEELLAARATAAALCEPHRRALAEVLGGCDLVKFARRESSEAERERLLENAASLVEAARERRELAA